MYKDKKGISGTQAGKMTRDDKLNDSGNAPDAEDFIFSLCLGVLIMYTGNTYSRVQCVHLGTEDRTNGPVPVFRKGEPCYRLFKIAYPDSTFFYLILWGLGEKYIT